MAHLLHQIGLLQGKSDYLNLAKTLVGKVQENISSYPGGHSNWSRSHLAQSMPYYEIAIVGKNAKEIAKKLQQADIPNALIVFTDSKSNLPIFKDRFINGKTNIYVCQTGVCQLPVESIPEALKLMK